MASDQSDEQESDLPTYLSNPTKQALAVAGISTLAQISQMTEDDLLALHGVGPKTIRQLRPVLEEKGLAFREAPAKKSRKAAGS